MIRIIITTCICLVLLSTTAMAQELGIGLSGGMQGLQYKFNQQNSQLKAGTILDIGYTFPLGKNLGIISGITCGTYTSEIVLNGQHAFNSYEVDESGSAFIYNVTINGYKEQQRFIAAGIPVMLQYHTSGKTQWYINGGAKLLFPFSGKYTSSATQVITTGFYPDYNILLKDLPHLGFGTVNNWRSDKGALSLKATATISAATGISFEWNDFRLYTGIYMDYGLNNLADKPSDGTLVTYSSSGINNMHANSILKRNGMESAKLLGYGIQVRLGIPTRK
ncbi:MAG: hypothetical protein JO154_22370 [Chitinophaga sp.]|uniref:outer membrane beta-barrel protein n=1 Tax=Chitinophaga sp. TaxID=1869181 RepID=UPI0025BFF65C|nr:outer membrane beta-barrel protein [Chitinophaga sp.]MBV8255363.1 hypothetical protein [Chitinophaga sp.]